jgi:phosphoglycerol transferase MdoB-like AlkP superfamily enzyme
VAVARRGTVGGAPAMLLGGVAIAIGAGFAHLSWLVHSQLPTQLTAWFARSVVAASVAAGVAFAALGAVGSLGPRRYEETGSVIDD